MQLLGKTPNSSQTSAEMWKNYPGSYSFITQYMEKLRLARSLTADEGEVHPRGD